MSSNLVSVDFKNRKVDNSDDNVTKTYVTFEYLDHPSAEDIEVTTALDVSQGNLTTGDVVGALFKACDEAEVLAVNQVWDKDNSRDYNDISDELLLELVYIGMPETKDTSKFVVEGIKIRGEYIDNAVQVVYATSSIDAELQVRITEAMERGYDMAIDFQSLLAFISNMSCDNVTAYEDVDEMPMTEDAQLEVMDTHETIH